MTTLREALPAKARQFIEQHALQPYMALAFDLIDSHFPDAKGVKAEFMEDPESPDEWVTLVVRVAGELSDIMSREDRLTDAWTAAVPWPAADQIVILMDIR
jgi:hypothetical protein